MKATRTIKQWLARLLNALRWATTQILIREVILVNGSMTSSLKTYSIGGYVRKHCSTTRYSRRLFDGGFERIRNGFVILVRRGTYGGVVRFKILKLN